MKTHQAENNVVKRANSVTEYIERINAAVKFIQNQKGYKAPELGIALGSGLGSLADNIGSISIPFSEIPGFPVSSVKGRAGKLVIGKLEGKNVVIMQDRFHYYEGFSLREVTFPIRVMKQLGI